MAKFIEADGEIQAEWIDPEPAPEVGQAETTSIQAAEPEAEA